jgi:cytochrome P460
MMRMTRRTRAALAFAIAGLAALAWAGFTSPVESQQGARPVYTPDGTMMQLPAGFETWVFVGSNLGLAYKPEMTENDAREANRAAEQQFFHNVYINPEAYAHFAATKEFPDPTILVMEVFLPEDRDPRGVLKSGVFNGQRRGIEVAVKDTRRPANHLTAAAASPWAYYIFMNPFEQQPVLHQTVRADRGGSCQACHKANAPPDNVWVRFYPALRKFVP